MIPKCRGRHKDSGELVIGWYRYRPHGFYPEHHILKWVNANAEVALRSEWDVYEVHPDSVSQSTGLEDKKGTEIFDHDIIAIDGRETLVQVVWRKKWAGFDFLRMDGNDASAIFGEATKKYTVISNIHTNPDLLTANQEVKQ